MTGVDVQWAEPDTLPQIAAGDITWRKASFAMPFGACLDTAYCVRVTGLVRGGFGIIQWTLGGGPHRKTMWRIVHLPTKSPFGTAVDLPSAKLFCDMIDPIADWLHAHSDELKEHRDRIRGAAKSCGVLTRIYGGVIG